ncbi:EAL domain-containing protein [Methylomonas methanica]|uniref:cyclic-guanylate-specific phosphodiesterase n=1 Tax=Methylomonas methanica (strain DSM 25384 / MC09) TaxID=857087 RepID=F9ZVU6_METMM|nr:EAL domain-containing protein [Methylomonas methanica]AEF99574.1 response regulator receiver modulated diguanylate cyclase/phosphodiesterase with PAS/PAC sensor(s) [Methylomonas methanica MC09]
MNSPALKVLYIEDSASDADLTRRALQKTSPYIELDIAVSLAEGMTKLSEAKRYDLLLSDLALPDGNGLDALAYIRDKQLPMPVVILTGSGDQEAAIAALKAGADDYLVKRDGYLRKLPAALELAITRFRENTDRNHRILRVLQVEHNTFDIDLTGRHLAQHAPHIRLTQVSTAQEALRLLDGAVDFDALLTDYRLPGMDGLELTKILRRERDLDMAIVLVSGQGSEDVAARALHLGVDDYLIKHEGYLYELPATLQKVVHQVELNRERVVLKQTAKRLSRVLAASPTILYNLRFFKQNWVTTWVSDNILRQLGYTPEQAMQPGWWLDHIHPDDQVDVAENRSMQVDHLIHEYRFRHADGHWVWIRDELRQIRDSQGQPIEIVGAWQDIREQKRTEAVRFARQSALDRIVANQPLPLILDDIARRVEAIYPDMRVSILLIDTLTGRLTHGAAPSLPDFYNQAVEQLEPAIGRGSCGTAAKLGEPVIVADIEQHPYWADYLDLARRAGLGACWSVPFKDEAGRVLGTFGIYHKTKREPTPEQLELIDEFTRITALAVQKVRATDILRQAAAVFDSTREGILITDLKPRIVAVNRAYTDITGYSETDALGKNPSCLKSGRHDKVFFQELWTKLSGTGHWQGEIWNRRKNGEFYPQWLTINTVYNESGSPCRYVGVFSDISQIKESEARLERLAHFDPLTNLPNRLLAQSRLRHAVEHAGRHGHRVAVLYLDLDRFKTVNDSLGHPSGDELLSLLAGRLSKRLRDEDTLARLGGDEFLLVLECIEAPEVAATVAQSLIDLLLPPFDLSSGQEIYLGVSIGISLYPDDAGDVTELIQHADMAMYLAKQEGRNTYRFHTPALSRAASERLSLETCLRRALTEHEFVLHYQMLIDARTEAVIGVEALVRWQPAGKALVPPGIFIPIAEETGLIVPLGEWVLSTACKQGKAWMDAGIPALIMAVNLSVRQFQSVDVVELVRRVLADSGFPADRLELELTEGMLMDDAKQSIATLNALKELGVRLSIDDFGTGYSSLAYLKRFPIDKLKIDQSFVRGLSDDINDREITATIIAMSRVLKLDVLAEGVETEQQLAFLRESGCDYYQGYWFHKPEPAADLQKRLGDFPRKIYPTG